MAGSEFHHEVTLSIFDLEVRPFVATSLLTRFSCGNGDLDEFLKSKEVGRYETEGLGKTYLVFHEGVLAAYFTVSLAELRAEYLQTWKSFSGFADMNVEAVPALKIGRLAVDVRFQKRGIGRVLVNYIAGLALEPMGQAGVRLLMVQAKPESIEFYKKCGFQLTV